MISMTHPTEEVSHGSSPAPYHRPVLVEQILKALLPAPGKLIVDGTLGGGGHCEALLAAGASVIGIDHDPDAIAFATGRLETFGQPFRATRGTFAEVDSLLDALGVGRIDGALLDLGVSSHQIDTPGRGFSFQQDGPLDMRMNPEGIVTASDLVNTMSAEQIERILRQYGEEPAARRISERIVRERRVGPIKRTLELAALVEAVTPRRGRTHPATRVFQALRIAVNREMEALDAALEQFSARLASGGRFAVVTFHSGEDRAVKTFFKTRSDEWIDRPEWPEARPNPGRIFRRVTGKALVASEAEQKANPRSRSAKLRVVEKI